MSNYKMQESDYSVLDKNIKIVVLSAEFNRDFTKGLEDKNIEFLNEKWFSNIEKYMVPGAFEIPWFLKEVLNKKNPDLVLCFWVVIRWETTHYEMVAWESARWIMNLTIKNKTKSTIINWILTCENEEQVKARIANTYALSGLNVLSERKKIEK